jgi:hypothetical protein
VSTDVNVLGVGSREEVNGGRGWESTPPIDVAPMS